MLEEFNVLETLFNMAIKEIKGPCGFEGLLRYYMKLSCT
jgi:hypothetical protein